MKRIMVAASVVAALSLGISSSVLAGDKGSKGGKQLGGSSQRIGQLQNGGQQLSNRNLSSQTFNSNVILNKKNGLGQASTPRSQTLNQSNGDKLMKNGKHDLGLIKDKVLKNKHVEFKFKKNCDFKLYTGHCYIGQQVKFWTNCYFDPYYGCEIYYCPVRTCWYFWYAPWSCYLPCDYFVNVCEF
jgi:hypothetical protein